MEMNFRIKTIINILMASMTFLILAVFVFDIERICIFEHIFHFKGPVCGLTRSIVAFLKLDFNTSLKTYFLGIPIFFIIILIYIIYFIDLFLKKNILEKWFEKICKHQFFLINTLIILTIINNL